MGLELKLIRCNKDGYVFMQPSKANPGKQRITLVGHGLPGGLKPYGYTINGCLLSHNDLYDCITDWTKRTAIDRVKILCCDSANVPGTSNQRMRTAFGQSYDGSLGAELSRLMPGVEVKAYVNLVRLVHRLMPEQVKELCDFNEGSNWMHREVSPYTNRQLQELFDDWKLHPVDHDSRSITFLEGNAVKHAASQGRWHQPIRPSNR